ncbi:MAG: hypothetical protein KDG89_18270, partial [Geminicoccaceae bacterium]|nr:hypothetical protein [Geminicoccaceae bacterium]
AVMAALRGAEQAPARSAGPRPSKVILPDGSEIETRLEVVELDDLIASHGDDLAPNPAFPPELQPRDRGRAASAEQVTGMAARLDPRLLGDTPTPGEGAPIVGLDGVVESGNGRTLALRRAYGQGLETGGRYRAWLAGQGFEVAGMKAPVLIRRRTTDLTPERRVAFTRQANEGTVARMGASEQARGDAERLVPDVLDLVRSPDLQAAANRPFVRAFVAALPASERGALMAADGTLGRAGAARIEAALLARAYGDADLTARLVEGADAGSDASGLGPLGKALADAAPGIARLRAAIDAGAAAAEGDPVPGLLDAVRAVVQAREAKQPLDFPLMQGDLMGGGLGAEGRAWLAAMLRPTKGGPRLLGRQRLAELLGGVVDAAGRQAPGRDMFGGAPAGAKAILDGVVERQGRAIGRAPETLFQPMRQGVDLDIEVEVTTAAPRFAGQSYAEVRKSFPKDLRKAITDGGPYRNRDTGWDIAVSGTNLDHAVKRSETGKAGELPRNMVDRLEAVANLPALLERAVLVESRSPMKPAPTVAAIHRLYAPFEVDGRLYTVRLTVRERNARVVEVEGIEMFGAYDVALEKRVPAGTSPERSPGPTADTPATPAGTSREGSPNPTAGVLKVRTLLEGVKDDAGDPYFQRTPEGQPRGSITFHEDGRAVIELFETADASTVVHEGAHLFTRMLEDLAPHSAEVAADLGVLKAWTGAGDGPLLPVHHEKIADAFEAWIAGGAAPSSRLEGAFRTLASFMAKLFGDLKAQGRRATPEVEAVFARMLEVRPEVAPKPARIADPVMAAFD